MDPVQLRHVHSLSEWSTGYNNVVGHFVMYIVLLSSNVLAVGRKNTQARSAEELRTKKV